jgi:hypothetical protein
VGILPMTFANERQKLAFVEGAFHLFYRAGWRSDSL